MPFLALIFSNVGQWALTVAFRVLGREIKTWSAAHDAAKKTQAEADKLIKAPDAKSSDAAADDLVGRL